MVPVVAAEVQEQMQGGGSGSGHYGPDEGQREEGVGGEERKEDIPGMVAFRPAEHAHKDLEGLGKPTDQRQVPGHRQTERSLKTPFKIIKKKQTQF